MINPNSEGITRVNSLRLEGGPHRLVVNEKSNFIHLLDLWSNSVISIDGLTNTISDHILLRDAREIAVDPEANRLYILGDGIISIMDVTNDNSIRYVEESSIKVHSETKMAFDYGRNLIYLTNRSYKSIDVIDSETGKMIMSIPLKKKPIEIVMDQNTKMIYVGIDSPATLIIIDGNVNRIIKEIDLRIKESIWCLSPKRHYLRQVYINHSIKTLYALYKQPFFIPESCYSGRTEYQDGILLFDPSNQKMLGDQKLRRGLNQLCINEKNNKIYCANSHYKDIEVLNEDGCSEVLNIPLQGDKVYDMALNSTTNKLYVVTRRMPREALLEIYDLDDSTLDYQLDKQCVLL